MTTTLAATHGSRAKKQKSLSMAAPKRAVHTRILSKNGAFSIIRRGDGCKWLGKLDIAAANRFPLLTIC